MFSPFPAKGLIAMLFFIAQDHSNEWDEWSNLMVILSASVLTDDDNDDNDDDDDDDDFMI